MSFDKRLILFFLYVPLLGIINPILHTQFYSKDVNGLLGTLSIFWLTLIWNAFIYSFTLNKNDILKYTPLCLSIMLLLVGMLKSDFFLERHFAILNIIYALIYLIVRKIWQKKIQL
ncbi:hypothetical protein AVL50_31720 [Flammeovirga sp. SJP92]|nr:hypothetical protein AVL50_31720 [Flammeovirga sp. SJP92]